MGTEKVQKRKLLPGLKVMYMLNASIFVFLALVIIAGLKDWNTFGLIVFGAFILACIGSPIALFIAKGSVAKAIAQSQQNLLDIQVDYGKKLKKERQLNPPEIKDSALQSYYENVTRELDARIESTSYLGYFTDPYCTVRQSLVLNIIELVKEQPDANLKILEAKIQQDALYNRKPNGDLYVDGIHAEYQTTMSHLQEMAR